MNSKAIKKYIYGTPIWHALFKNRSELKHWLERKQAIIKWYRREEAYIFPFPSETERITGFDDETNALLTFIKVENKHASYLSDLCLRADSFRHQKVADIGSGPFPTLLVFDDCERYCIDHLIHEYEAMGYPLTPFKSQVNFLNAKSEDIPVPDGFFDAIISRNALDHVDDFARTADELKRVLKGGGVLHVQVNYHQPTATEPHVLNDEVILASFSGLQLRKIREVKGAWGFTGGSTVIWSNASAAVLQVEEENAINTALNFCD